MRLGIDGTRATDSPSDLTRARLAALERCRDPAVCAQHSACSSKWAIALERERLARLAVDIHLSWCIACCSCVNGTDAPAVGIALQRWLPCAGSTKRSGSGFLEDGAVQQCRSCGWLARCIFGLWRLHVYMSWCVMPLPELAVASGSTESRQANTCMPTHTWRTRQPFVRF